MRVEDIKLPAFEHVQETFYESVERIKSHMIVFIYIPPLSIMSSQTIAFAG